MLGAGTEAINAGCEDNKAFFRRGKCYRHLGELDKANSFLSLSLLVPICVCLNHHVSVCSGFQTTRI